MAIRYLRRLAGKSRNPRYNQHLARYLAFIAGATNAGGFLAVQQYTSHMSGIVSAMADHLALGDLDLMLAGVAAMLAFLAGAACSAILVNWARRRHLQSEFALPLLLEALLLLAFGVLGTRLELHEWLFAPVTVSLLCFIMGLQNALVTKLSKAEIRTTHVTGMVTDIGIELGKLAYWNRRRADTGLVPVRGDLAKLQLLATLVGLFFLGGVTGALGFKRLGFELTLPLAAILLALAVVPVLDDLRLRPRRRGVAHPDLAQQADHSPDERRLE